MNRSSLFPVAALGAVLAGAAVGRDDPPSPPIGDTLKHDAAAVGEAVKDGAQKVGQKAREVGQVVAKEAKKGAHEVAKAGKNGAAKVRSAVKGGHPAEPAPAPPAQK